MKWILDFQLIDTKVHPKFDSSLRKFKEISWCIDYPSLLKPLQTAYFMKLSNLEELRTHLYLCWGVEITFQKSPWKITTLQTRKIRKIPLQVLMRTHFFTVIFPVINHWLAVDVVETGDEFSIFYVFITISIKLLQWNLYKVDTL